MFIFFKIWATELVSFEREVAGLVWSYQGFAFFVKLVLRHPDSW